MNQFTVSYAIPAEGGDLVQLFRCMADDDEHAREQCLDAYPACNILNIAEFAAPPRTSEQFRKVTNWTIVWDMIEALVAVDQKAENAAELVEKALQGIEENHRVVQQFTDSIPDLSGEDDRNDDGPCPLIGEAATDEGETPAFWVSECTRYEVEQTNQGSK